MGGLTFGDIGEVLALLVAPQDIANARASSCAMASDRV